MRSTANLLAGLSLFIGWCSSAQQVEFQLDSNVIPLKSSLPVSSSSSGSQAHFFAETITSTLSSSTEHTILLHLLQRSKSIPLLAHIGNATFFAPTDQAWREWAERNQPDDEDERRYNGWLGAGGLSEWQLSEDDLLASRIGAVGEEDVRTDMDNHNWALRQHLLYHMLNYTLPPSAFVADEGKNITTETTLLFPLSEEPEHPPIPEPGPPWLPRGGEGMLGGHGQRLRIARAGSTEGGKRGKVDVDWKGQGGAEFWDGGGWNSNENGTTLRNSSAKGRKGDHGDSGGVEQRNVTGIRWVRNGVVVGVDSVLDMPPSIEEIIRTNPSLSYLSSLLPAGDALPDPLPDSFAMSSHLTIFAPSNGAFATLDDIERRYLEGGSGGEGVGRIFGSGVVLGVGKDQQVGWGDAWGHTGYQVATASGEDLLVEAPSTGTLLVNGTEAETVDIFASNGVVHIVPNLLLPENFTLLNSAEKVLLSLNATRFVSLLRSANLSHTYVGEHGSNEEEAWTILAPTDEVLDMAERCGGLGGAPIPQIWRAEDDLIASTNSVSSQADEPFRDASPIAALLQYHFLPGRLLPPDIKDGMLLGTELRTSALRGGRQRLRVDVSERLDRYNWKDMGGGEIRFGGSAVLGKPVKSGKSIIYLISSLLSPPDDVLQTAVSDLQLSTFIAAVYAADLDKALKSTPATTYFIPRNKAFASLGLAMRYLLLPEGKDELRKVIRYHAVDAVVYSQDVEDGREHYKTHEGGEVVLVKTSGKNGSIELHSPTRWPGHDSGDTLPANGELRSAKLSHTDALTDTGVIHTIDSVVLPADINLTIGKLIRGSRQSTMMDLLIRAGLGWVLEGREPTGEEVERVALDGIVGIFDKEGGEASPDIDSLAMPSYTILCPTDKAFSRLNLTHYLSDRDALLDLLKLHIIPTQSTTFAPDTNKRIPSPPQDGQPLSLSDDLIHHTLLSSTSKYGDLAFRATGDNSYIVGIRNARNGNGNDFARVGAGGRASVRWRNPSVPGQLKHKDEKTPIGDRYPQPELWKGGMALGGGVLVIDTVLVPFEPSWFSRWGWLVITLTGLGLVLIGMVIGIGWWWVSRGRKEGYEPLEGEEEE